MSCMRVFVSLIAAVVIAVGGPETSIHAEQNEKPPQYRYRNESIVAAGPEEARREKVSAESAREYLDGATQLWAKQKRCISCHTHGVYSIVRPALAPQLGEPPSELREFLVAESERIIRGEGLNGSSPTQLAYIARGLAEWDAHIGGGSTPETDRALRHLFDLQTDEGALPTDYRWPPINSDSYHGAVMALMAAATTPDWLDDLREEKLLRQLEKMKQYVRDSATNNHHRLLRLWASSRVPGLLEAAEREAVIEMIERRQLADGGWSVQSFDQAENLASGRRLSDLKADPYYRSPRGDGYQTGLVVVVLREAGVDEDHPPIRRAVEWLRRNQRTSGRWWTKSLNADSRFHYISFSGSAYATLALAKCNALVQ